VGKKVEERQLMQFEPGVTSCEEVLLALGEPTQKSLAADRSRQFIYNYAQAQVRWESLVPLYANFARGSDSEQTNVVIDCDPQGRLVQFTSTSGKVGSGTGFSSGARQ
jgi:outer membrane protein assembly factor BamE (lipoprotein component of BamABCDE complex)